MVQWESQCEDLWVIIEVPFMKYIRQIALCAVYLPPPVTRSTLDIFLDSCNLMFERTGLHTCIIGDFNLSNIKWNLINDSANNYAPPGFNNLLVDFIHTHKLVQLNDIVNVSGRILDLVLTNLPSSNVTAALSSLTAIDVLHPPIEILLRGSKETWLPYNSHNTRINFFKLDYVKICHELDNVDWDMLLRKIIDVNDMLRIFYDTIWNVIQLQGPPKSTCGKKKYPPWFSRQLVRALKAKEKIRCRYKIYKNPMDELELRLLGKRCSKLATDSYNSYIKGIEDEITKNPNRFWAYIKDKRGGYSSFPATMTNGIVVTSDGLQICEMFASHFSSAFSNLKATHYEPVSDYLLNMKNNSLPLTTPVIDHATLFNKLKALDVRKGAGPDGIPPIFITKCASSLVCPLVIIFTKSLSSGVFPDSWKKAKVVPIYKNDEKDHCNNYRPISILSTFAKIFESLICPHLQSHLKLYLSDSQHGFVGSRSTSTNLATFTEMLTNAIDRGKQVDVIYTDFSKAFDRVPHHILLAKLSAYGITGTLHTWLKSYLERRFFFVAVNGFRSPIYEITSGVPQGSHVGPIMFNAFANDIPHCLKFSECFMYADDLKFSRVIESDEDIDLLQSDVDSLVQWCSENGMELNVKKCYHVKFTRKKIMTASIYHVGSDVIQEVSQVRDLGVNFDSQLTFVPHVESIIKKASKMLGFVIRNITGFRRSSTKILLYNSIVRSVLEYCSTIWRPHYATHNLRLERIQKRFLWHLAFANGISKRKRSYDARLAHFKMVSLEKRRRIADSIFLFKILRGKIDCPQLLSNFMFRAPARFPRAPITPLYPPPRRTVLGMNSIVPRLCKLLNSYSDLVDVQFDSFGKFHRIASNNV
ncbi:hypothetical protein PYW07_005461 [Mythimna separata]|uniref:Reverse transcriptase domain-containing protein n=1 Tax=Mythimna separata TaxID=271217 RepID=A0AAD7YEC7_MYTSE|nr:hypothetical protein PYW07_005461 [Mythimna separata]